MVDNHIRLKPKIKVIGIGGGGGNALNNIIPRFPGYEQDFIACNTDAQALANSLAPIKIQLGANCTRGLGAGADPAVGANAARESLDEVLQHTKDADMVFITAGMGGGTGTGAAPVIAEALRSLGVLVVAVVTKPFLFEGYERTRVALAGIDSLKNHTDTLLIIANQNLFGLINHDTSILEGFAITDGVLCSGIQTIMDLIMKHGLINLDFADVSAVMREMVGNAVMGTGEAAGPNRAIEAAEIATSCPLLNETSINGAKCILINITGGHDLKLFEIDAAVNYITSIAGDAKVIFGTVFDESMDGNIRVSFIATGILDKPVAPPVVFNESETSYNLEHEHEPKYVAMETEVEFNAEPEHARHALSESTPHAQDIKMNLYQHTHPKKLSFFDRLLGKKDQQHDNRRPVPEQTKKKPVPGFLNEE